MDEANWRGCMKMIKILSKLAGILVLAGSITVAVAKDAPAVTPDLGKIAVINVQQVLQQSPKVAAVSKKLESDFKDRQAKIGDEQKVLQDELEKFKQTAATISQKDRDVLQKKSTTDRAELVKKVVA